MGIPTQADDDGVVRGWGNVFEVGKELIIDNLPQIETPFFRTKFELTREIIDWKADPIIGIEFFTKENLNFDKNFKKYRFVLRKLYCSTVVCMFPLKLFLIYYKII